MSSTQSAGFHDDSKEVGRGESDPWERYYDEAAQAYYWYNHSTGESQWDEQQPSANLGDEIELINIDKQEKSSLISDKSNEEVKAKKAKRKSKTKRKAVRFCELDWNSMLYYVFLWFNIVICEAPAVLVECVLRMGLLLVLLLCTVLYYQLLIRRNSASSSNSNLIRLKEYILVILRDLSLTAAAALTLTLPGALCLVYREMVPSTSTTDDEAASHWQLVAIPTLLGAVDPRRLAALTVFGVGSGAANAFLEESESSLDVWPNSLVYLPRNTLYRCQNMTMT